MPGRIKWCDYPVDFDSRISDRTDGDGERDPLQQREVDVDVEPLRRETGEAAGDGMEGLADGRQVIESLAKAEVGEVVGAQFVAQEGRELLVLFEEGVLEIDAQGT